MSENKNMGPCRTCGEQIALTAKVCPKCGQKKPLKGRVRKRYIVIGVVLLLAYLGSLNPPQVSAEDKAALEIKNNLADLCRNAIRASVTNISTLDLDYSGKYTAYTDGSKQYVWGFSAKNGFGLELSYNAYCTLLKSGKFDFRTEQRER